MEEEKVVLVDSDNSVLGTMGKLQAHQEGLLHRAFSVFIFNTNGQLLLQQRALEKYHSPGKWTNTCCSHPRFQEKMIDGAKRRLAEEMGMTCELDFAFDFIYKAALDQGLIEHELDFVFVGISDQLPRLNKDEVLAFKYVVMEDLENDLQHHESNYTAWLKICFPKVKEHYQKLFKDGRLDR